MKHLSIQGSPNYTAVIVQFDPANVVELKGRDRVVGYKVLGYQSIIQKTAYVPGDLLVVFGAETQLSEAYAHANNLYRHEHLNQDTAQSGYLDDNRRVKAIKFAGHRSDALVMPVWSLLPFMDGHDRYPEPGTAFDHIGDVEISRKYVVPVKASNQSMSGKQGQRKVRVSSELFPEHYDTANGFRNADAIEPNEHVVVTQKLHGTSVRLANVPVVRDLKWYERLAQKLGVKVKTHEYGIVVGSRRVTKSIDGKVESGKQHFYSDDIWTTATEGMGRLLPENFVVYGEIVGWTPDGAPIQPGYTYGVQHKATRVYVYRVATVNAQGDLVDLPWRAVEKFCEARGWLTTPALASGPYDMFIADDYLDTRYIDTFTFERIGGPEVRKYPTAVPLSDQKLPDEGVVVRADTGFQPTALKYKSPAFLRHESVVLDQGEADVESQEAA